MLQTVKVFHTNTNTANKKRYNTSTNVNINTRVYKKKNNILTYGYNPIRAHYLQTYKDEDEIQYNVILHYSDWDNDYKVADYISCVISSIQPLDILKTVVLARNNGCHLLLKTNKRTAERYCLLLPYKLTIY